MDRLHLGVIGCGARGRSVVAHLLNADPKHVRVAAVFDIDPESIATAKQKWRNENITVHSGPEALIADPEVNFIMIFTPNVFHKEALVASMRAGKPTFTEKPLATTLPDCREIVRVQHETKVPVITGFVLRYSPIYRKVKELLDSGRFGRIINISASENRESFGGGNSMSSRAGWRRDTAIAGPYLLEKCSHDLDILNWYIGAMPSRVAGFGGLDLFVPENRELFDEFGYEVFGKMVPEHLRINPFTSPKNIRDNHAVALEYPGGVKVLFQLTLANAIPERRMYISCTKGTIIFEVFSGELRFKRYDDEYVTTLNYPASRSGHGGGDPIMAREIIDTMLGKGGAIKTSVEHGLACAVVALCAEEAMAEGAVVEIPDFSVTAK